VGITHPYSTQLCGEKNIYATRPFKKQDDADYVSKFFFKMRQLATEFKLACIVELIRVKLLRQRLGLVQISGAFLSKIQYWHKKPHKIPDNHYLK